MKTSYASARTGHVSRLVGKRRARWALALAILLGIVAPGVRWSHGEDAVGRQMPDEGRGHVAPGTHVEYQHHPPTSGQHWPSPAPWGVFEQEVPPETWVHNLEHGGIVILYRCETPCPDLVRQLHDVYATFPGSKYSHVKLLVTPANSLKTRLAILAWRWIDELSGFDGARLLRFYRAHVDRGPEDIP